MPAAFPARGTARCGGGGCDLHGEGGPAPPADGPDRQRPAPPGPRSLDAPRLPPGPASSRCWDTTPHPFPASAFPLLSPKETASGAPLKHARGGGGAGTPRVPVGQVQGVRHGSGAGGGREPRDRSAPRGRSFAYFTIKDRLPQILTRVIDTLHRHKNEFFEEHGEKGVEAEKRAISFLSKLRNELQTDKPVTPLEDELPDAALWNQYLDYQRNLSNGNGEPSWFQSPWLFVECYMYRRIHAALAQNPPIDNFDVFKEGKAQNFFESQEAVIALCTYFQELLKNIKDLDEKQLKEELFKLLQVSLWGNKCDLSFSAGEDSSQKSSPLQSLENMVPYILVNDMEKVWSLLVNAKTNRTERSNVRVDIILDNAGFELVSDLVLADFLLSSKLADEIYFHGKSIPWYVSDTTKHDFNWTVKQLQSANHMWMSRCGINWEGNLKKGVWVFCDHMFWTLPHDFSSMGGVAPDLYAELQKSNLIFFKGDLNYRKLTGDRKWEYSVPFHQALNKFHPAPLCSLRTLKSDTQVGLKPGQGEQIQASEPEWMVSGKYGVVQFDAGL
ncbi:protein-glutamate O-methyltransferase [Corapipo altera]|uniref:protein-glutamate O-methyltransferase n=1 Tax=Corapipo altera TaxID=415028 RepID=UPI000FD6531B|nr:protein-glutamate O-methyltransferase [Corapipo altera]